jgi:hypothetical protein
MGKAQHTALKLLPYKQKQPPLEEAAVCKLVGIQLAREGRAFADGLNIVVHISLQH